MGEVLIDLHQHLTDINWELKNVDVNEVLSRAQQQLGRNGILGIVDFFGRNKEQKFEIVRDRIKKEKPIMLGEDSLYLSKRRLFLTRLQESETREGHILTLGLNAGVYMPNSRDLPLEEALKKSAVLGKGAIADHPFGYQGIGRYLKENPRIVLEGKLTGYEINNRLAVWFPTKTPLFPNFLARKWYNQMLKQFPNLPMGALYGNDGHNVKSIGVNYNFLTMPPAEEIVERKDLVSPLVNAIIQNKTCDGRKSFSFKDAYFHALKLVLPH